MKAKQETQVTDVINEMMHSSQQQSSVETSNEAIKRREELREQLLAAMRAAEKGGDTNQYEFRMLLDDRNLKGIITEELIHRYKDYLTVKSSEERAR